MLRPQHTCPEDAAITLQAVCEDGSIGASDVFILIAVIIGLAAVSFIVFNFTRRRFLTEDSLESIPEEEEDEATGGDGEERDQ